MKLSLAIILIGSLFNLGNKSQDIYLVPGGENIAFELKNDGITVTGSYEVQTKEKKYNPSRDSDIQKGDILHAIEGYRIHSLDEFVSYFNQFIHQEEVEIDLTRKGKPLKRKLFLLKDNGKIKTGLYVKERVLGIGTMSFYDPESKIYGALGHEVYDQDSQEMVDVQSGSIYKSAVLGIKNNGNKVGEKVGSTELKEKLGSALKNTPYGLFGKIDEVPKSYVPIPMAKQNEVKIGKAKIQTVTQGFKIEEYSIEITDLKPQNDIDVKGISFTITDETLLSIGGGIYYGMSGSPIIQNGKLVGAVTHVLSDNKISGYGIYMESMYEAAKNVLN